MAKSAKKCDFCGPPFDIITNIVGREVCCIGCGVRYVREVLGKPSGFNVIFVSSEKKADGKS